MQRLGSKRPGNKTDHKMLTRKLPVKASSIVIPDTTIEMRCFRSPQMGTQVDNLSVLKQMS